VSSHHIFLYDIKATPWCPSINVFDVFLVSFLVCSPTISLTFTCAMRRHHRCESVPSLPQTRFWNFKTRIRFARNIYVDLLKTYHQRLLHSPPKGSGPSTARHHSRSINLLVTLFDRSAKITLVRAATRLHARQESSAALATRRP
jgi:hypothetical protein